MFSNMPDGGMIVYGVEDDGTIVGLNHWSQDQLNKLESSHLQRCPMSRPEFKRIPLVIAGKPEFCLAVYAPYIGRLVETNKGEAYVRYGESKHAMSEPEKNDFRSTRQELSFELTAATQMQYPDDFDLRIVQDFCDAFRRKEGRQNWTNEEVLLDRNLLARAGQHLRPLNALVLMAAKNPRSIIPGCRIRVLRFEGESEGWGESYSPVVDRYCEGNLVQIIQHAQELLSTVIHDVTWLGPEGKFVTTPEYPKWAWLEGIINACVHRSYSFSGTEIVVKLFSDRMEIDSPGGFVPPVNVRTIYETRAARNPHLMDALRFLGYVRMAREGTRRIRESMISNQLPEPVFSQETINGILVRVTLKNDHLSRKRASDRDVAMHFGVDVWRKLSEQEVRIAAFVYHNGEIHVSDAQRLTGRTWATSKKDLDRLMSAGILVFVPGSYQRDSKAKYVLAPRKDAPNAPEAP